MPKHRIKTEQTDLACRATIAIEYAHAAKETFNNTAISFLLTELDAAITFCKVCKVALDSSSNHARIDRELDYVEHAIESALRTKEYVRLQANERKRFRERVQQLGALVTRLATRLPSPKLKKIEGSLRRFRGLGQRA